MFVVVSCFGGCGYWRRRNYGDVVAESNGFGGGGGGGGRRDSTDDNDAHHRECSSFVSMHGGLRLHGSVVVQDHPFDRHGQRHPLRFHPAAGNLFNPPPNVTGDFQA